jgi:hypothetical protein
MSRTDFLRKDSLPGDVATEHRGRKGRLRPVGDCERGQLGPGAVRSTVCDMATYTEAVLRAGRAERTDPAAADAHADVVAPVQSGSQDPGMGLAFSYRTSTAAESSAMTGTCPGSPSHCLSADGPVGVVVLTNTATLFVAHLLAEGAFARGLVCNGGLPAAAP